MFAGFVGDSRNRAQIFVACESELRVRGGRPYRDYGMAYCEFTGGLREILHPNERAARTLGRAQL